MSERRLADAYHLLEPERPLGVGGHGVVFPGVNKSSGEIMAIKQVSKKHLPPEALKRLGKRVKEEATLLRVAGEHRSVCSYKELFEGDDAWYIVTELARGGELFDRLVERGRVFAGGCGRRDARIGRRRRLFTSDGHRAFGPQAGERAVKE